MPSIWNKGLTVHRFFAINSLPEVLPPYQYYTIFTHKSKERKALLIHSVKSAIALLLVTITKTDRRILISFGLYTLFMSVPVAVFFFGGPSGTLFSTIESPTGAFSQSVCLAAAFLEFVSRPWGKNKRTPLRCSFLVGHQGLEPRTDRLWAGSSDQLS